MPPGATRGRPPRRGAGKSTGTASAGASSGSVAELTGSRAGRDMVRVNAVGPCRSDLVGDNMHLVGFQLQPTAASAFRSPSVAGVTPSPRSSARSREGQDRPVRVNRRLRPSLLVRVKNLVS